MHREWRAVELDAFLEVATGNHRHSSVWGAIAVLHVDPQELNVMIRMWLVVPDLMVRPMAVTSVVPPVPLSPSVESGHALPDLGVDNRVNAHPITAAISANQ